MSTCSFSWLSVYAKPIIPLDLHEKPRRPVNSDVRTHQIKGRNLITMLNLEASLIFVLSIAGLIVLPQLIGYLLSGLSGCAGTPFLIEGSLSFLAWGLVKSFSVCGGIVISLAVFGTWHGWHTWQQGGFVMMYTSSMLIMFSFAVLLMYREAETVASDIQKHFPKLYARCLAIHLWCSRHTTSI